MVDVELCASGGDIAHVHAGTEAEAEEVIRFRRIEELCFYCVRCREAGYGKYDEGKYSFHVFSFRMQN